MREPVKRTIYNNYNLEEYREEAEANLKEFHIINPTMDDIEREICFMDATNWECEKERLEQFFNDGSEYILQGYVGTWRGAAQAGFIFNDFMDAYCRATKDCDYVHIYDENGHFYIKCSHHDGTNLYEIKRITERGLAYFDRWEQNLNDKRTEEHIHNMIMKNYSEAPHFAYHVYGRKKQEFMFA